VTVKHLHATDVSVGPTLEKIWLHAKSVTSEFNTLKVWC